MRRRRVIIVLAACVLVGIGVVAFWPGEREPEYNGKKLSEWAKAYGLRLQEDASTDPNSWLHGGFRKPKRLIEEEEKAADDAIRQMGTNCIPWLLRSIAYKPSVWKERLWRILDRIPIKYTRRFYHRPDFSDFIESRLAAVRGFEILGPEAAPAVPALTQIVKDWRLDYDTFPVALRAMSSTGKDALLPLMGFLEDTDLKRFAAIDIVAMSDTGVDITPAIPAILMVDREASAIEKNNNFYPRYAIGDAEALSGMRHLHFLTSALTNCMHHTNLVIQIEAINALGRLRAIARPAVPALKEALDVPVVAVQEAAVNALEKIAPEVLTNGATEVSR